MKIITLPSWSTEYKKNNKRFFFSSTIIYYYIGYITGGTVGAGCPPVNVFITKTIPIPIRAVSIDIIILLLSFIIIAITTLLRLIDDRPLGEYRRLRTIAGVEAPRRRVKNKRSGHKI